MDKLRLKQGTEGTCFRRDMGNVKDATDRESIHFLCNLPIIRNLTLYNPGMMYMRELNKVIFVAGGIFLELQIFRTYSHSNLWYIPFLCIDNLGLLHYLYNLQISYRSLSVHSLPSVHGNLTHKSVVI